jgi:O-antigen ligase
MQTRIARPIHFLFFALQRGWFGLLLVMLTAFILPIQGPQKTYQASVQIQVLQFKGLYEQELETSFFARYFTTPASLALLRSKHPELSLQQLASKITASPIAETNIIVLKAQASTAHEAGQLVLDLYYVSLQKFNNTQDNLSNKIKASLQVQLQHIVGSSPAQIQRRRHINKLLADLYNPPIALLALSTPSPELVDITPKVPERQQIFFFATLIGLSFVIQAYLQANTRHRFKGAGNESTAPRFLISIVYILFALGCTWLLSISLIAGIGCMLALQVTTWLFRHTRLALPLYIALAGPGLGLSTNTDGILSRIFIGNLLFYILIFIWFTKKLLVGRALLSTKNRSRPNKNRLLLAPLIGLTSCGLLSIVASRLFPDSHVTYAFLHSNLPLTLVNISEASILLGLPLIIGLVPGLTRTRHDIQLILATYLGIGLIYAFGAIFAPLLGLVSQETLLGIQRPIIFGAISSGLGNLLALFTYVAFGLCLYTPSRAPRIGFFCLFCLLTIGVLSSLGREAWLSLLLAICAMSGMRNRRCLLLVIPVLLIIFILLISGSIDFFNPQKVYGSDRLAIWQDALTIWQRSPYFGVGAGNYQFFDLSYGSDIVGVAHNQYLEVLAEMGLQGLICLIWFLIVLGYLLFHRFLRAATTLGKAIALAGIGCYLTILFGGFFSDMLLPSAAAGGGLGPFIATSYRWLLLGLALSIPVWEKHQSEPPPPA